jgi:hypothetical protein
VKFGTMTDIHKRLQKEKELIRKEKEQSLASDGGASHSFSKGQQIEARYGGKQRFYPGVISKVDGNSLYQILYDDGEMEDNVAGSLIRGKETQAKATTFAKGQRIEARYGGKACYYPGSITAVKDDDGSRYDILYDDGGTESNVEENLIRVLGGANTAIGVSKEVGLVFSKGEKVEARYQGKTRYYSGVISKSSGTGKYQILYDDGEHFYLTCVCFLHSFVSIDIYPFLLTQVKWRMMWTFH